MASKILAASWHQLFARLHGLKTFIGCVANGTILLKPDIVQVCAIQLIPQINRYFTTTLTNFVIVRHLVMSNHTFGTKCTPYNYTLWIRRLVLNHFWIFGTPHATILLIDVSTYMEDDILLKSPPSLISKNHSPNVQCWKQSGDLNFWIIWNF